MKRVERYETRDGSLFECPRDAIMHEEYLDKLDRVSTMLPPLPQNDGCAFANGSGYIQHTKEAFNAYKSAILALGGEYCTKEMAEWAKDPESVHNMGVAGRYFDDGDHALYKLWNRVMCTDSQYREWGQPYYAINPGKGQNVQIAA